MSRDDREPARDGPDPERGGSNGTRGRRDEESRGRLSEGSSRWEIVSVNVSSEKGTIKQPVQSAVLDARGLVGDAHAGPWDRQVSLLGTEAIAGLARRVGRTIAPGEFGENLTVRGLDATRVGILDRIRVGRAELEVTQIGKECHGEGCAIFRQAGTCVMPSEGIFGRVHRGGPVRAGDAAVHEPRAFRCRVFTLSDRASRGEYEDRSGPLLRDRLEGFLRDHRFHPEVDGAVLSDEPERLRAALEEARSDRTDLVFTTGGTGVGPRDHAPEVVAQFCDRLVPGIMEAIRVRSGTSDPRALLSRSVAGVSDRILVFAVPGSPRAVNEYLDGILPCLEHLIRMVHGMGH